MKKTVLFALTIACFTQSCVTATYTPLKGVYPEKIYWRDSPRKFEESFDKIVEYLIELGYEPEEVDRLNGIVKMSGRITWEQITKENKKGEPSSPKRAVVVPMNPAPIYSLSTKIVIMVRPTQSGSVIGARLLIKNFDYIMNVNISAEAATLGNIEKTLIDGIVESK